MKHWFRLCVLSVFWWSGGAFAEPRVRWVEGDRPRVEVTGLEVSAAPEPLLRVYVVTDAKVPGAEAPSVAGEYARDADAWVFRPLFPPEQGVTYRAVLRVGDKPLTADLTVPARPPAAATVVKQVYPTADKLPENLLKFYVHFSAPMRRGRIYDHIRLFEES